MLSCNGCCTKGGSNAIKTYYIKWPNWNMDRRLKHVTVKFPECNNHTHSCIINVILWKYTFKYLEAKGHDVWNSLANGSEKCI